MDGYIRWMENLSSLFRDLNFGKFGIYGTRGLNVINF